MKNLMILIFHFVCYFQVASFFFPLCVASIQMICLRFFVHFKRNILGQDVIYDMGVYLWLDQSLEQLSFYMRMLHGIISFTINIS